MTFLNKVFSRKNILILFIAAVAFSFYGYFKWNNQFKITYYSQDTTLSGQLFKNIENTTVTSDKNKNPFSKVPYEKVTIKIGSIASKYKNSDQAEKSNNIINSEVLNEKFENWLREAFDEKEARKISNHVEIFYNDERVSNVGY